MRYDANGTWGTAKISNDKSKISSTNIQSGTYFVAQTNRDVKKVEIADQKSINASDWGLTTFENCKVQLEKTTDEITYATLGEQAVNSSTGFFIPDTYNIPESDLKGLTITNKIKSSFTISGTPTEVTVTAPTYTIEADKTNLNFGEKNANYESAGAFQTANITNTGNCNIDRYAKG